MFFFTCLNALGIAALVLFAASNAAPLPVVRDASSLYARGNAPSVANKLKACPTAEKALEMAQWRRLTDNALFWSDVGLPVVDNVGTQHKKKHLRDVFTDDVRQEISRVCGADGRPQDDFRVMSEAMATLAEGEAWVLKAADSPHDQFWELELSIIKKLKKVKKLYRVDVTGKKLETLIDIK